jgi:uncharacterized protein YbaP (TraB family)
MSTAILRLAFGFLALLTLCAHAVAADLPRSATPAMWTVEHEAGRAYLLGSIHLLPPETEWQTAEIKAAIAASSVFVFEAPINDANSTMARFVERHGRIEGGRSLREVIGNEAHEAVSRAAWQVHYPPRLLETVRPWLAAVYLELYSSLKMGSSPHFGVDHVIEQLANSRGAKVAYLETVEEQLTYFLKLSRKDEMRYLRATADGILTKPDAGRELLAAWASADVARLDALIEEGLADVPQLKVQLLTARNRKWLPAIEDMVKSGDVHFVTVGAAHLAGEDGIIGLLAARGYKITGPAVSAGPKLPR